MNNPAAAALWLVTLTDKGRTARSKNVVSSYVVTATSIDDARAAFEAELPGHMEQSHRVSIVPCDCRVMPTR